MARFQRQLAYRYKKKPHFKHVVVISSKAVSELGWKPGQELQQAVMANQTLLISPKKPKKAPGKVRR